MTTKQLGLTPFSFSFRRLHNENIQMVPLETTAQWSRTLETATQWGSDDVIFVAVINDDIEDPYQYEKQRKVTEIDAKIKKEFTRSYNEKIRAQQPHKSKTYNKNINNGGIHNKRYFR